MDDSARVDESNTNPAGRPVPLTSTSEYDNEPVPPEPASSVTSVFANTAVHAKSVGTDTDTASFTVTVKVADADTPLASTTP